MKKDKKYIVFVAITYLVSMLLIPKEPYTIGWLAEYAPVPMADLIMPE